MKSLKIILSITMFFLLFSCGNDKNNKEVKINNVGNKVEKQNVVNDDELKHIKTDEKSLENLKNNELDAILKKELDILNTPSSDYLFFEQMTDKTTTIEEIQKLGGMEITRGEIYEYGEKQDFEIIYNLLSEEDRKYVFIKNDDVFFYISGNYKDFLSNIKTNVGNYKLLSDENGFIDIELEKNNKKYFINIIVGADEDRDDIDRILGLKDRAKVTMFIGKFED